MDDGDKGEMGERWVYEVQDDPNEKWSSVPSQTRPFRARSPKRGGGASRLVIVFAFVLCVAVVVGVVIGGLRIIGNGANQQVTSTTLSPAADITVRQGMGATQVGALLEKAGLIESASEFVNVVKARGTTNSLKPGTYRFERGVTLTAIIEALETGRGATNLKITIPEGMAVDQVAALLDKGGDIGGTSYKDLAARPSQFSLPKVGGSLPSVDNLEGLLFPSTYFLVEGDTAAELIAAQLEAFQTKTSSLPWSNAQKLGVTPYEIVIIASMIEKEAVIADERPKVAAVIYNRLNKKMTLGIDATVRYALNKWTGPLTEKDLNVDSPYNTRVKKGLPPTPISSPGLAALKAALEPTKADYLYYVLSDTQGHHFFTASYEEFLKAKERAPQQ
jgi:UPF0755 protein